MGWQDADTELLETARQRHRANVGEEEDFRHTGVDLYHTWYTMEIAASVDSSLEVYCVVINPSPPIFDFFIGSNEDLWLPPLGY